MSDTFRSLFSGSKANPAGGGAKRDDGTSPISTREVRPDMHPGAVIRVLGAGGGGSNSAKAYVSVGGVPR